MANKEKVQENTQSSMWLWDQVKRPPADRLKTITGGRLKGMTDINPQWRLEILTKVLGACGDGWWYTIDKQWLEKGSGEQVVAFANISLYYRLANGEPSMPVVGTGGSMFLEAEKNGLHTSDEAFKMAITDAISVAAKQLGVGADIYAGRFDGKYRDEDPASTQASGSRPPATRKSQEIPPDDELPPPAEIPGDDVPAAAAASASKGDTVTYEDFTAGHPKLCGCLILEVGRYKDQKVCQVPDTDLVSSIKWYKEKIASAPEDKYVPERKKILHAMEVDKERRLRAAILKPITDADIGV